MLFLILEAGNNHFYKLIYAVVLLESVPLTRSVYDVRLIVVTHVE